MALARVRREHPEWAWEHQAEVYRERDLLVALLSRIYPSHVRQHPHSPRSHKLVVCIHTPFGQLAWTIAADALKFYEPACQWAEQDTDRATTAEKLDRIKRHIISTPPQFPTDARRLRKTT